MRNQYLKGKENMHLTPKSGLKSAVILPDRNYTVSESIWDGLISFFASKRTAFVGN